MVTGNIKSQIDQIWNAFWSGGISNPLEVIEQITYLLFLRRLDDLHTLEENKSARLRRPMERRVFPEGKDGIGQGWGRPYDDLRWSRFKHFVPSDMYGVVFEHVFPFLRTLGGDGSTYAHHMKDARFTIPTPALLAKVVDLLDAVPMEDRDTKGDVYEDASRQPVEVFLESLDLERFSQEGYLEEFEKWVGVKYGGRRMDAVVALGPVAYRVAVRWRDRLWPGLPLVFGAVDHGTFEAFGRVPGSTGALIEFGHLDSIRMGLEMFPETRHLAIVSGPPDRDGHARDFNSEIMSAFAGRLEIIQLAGLTLAEIVDRAGRLPDRSIIIVTSFSVDRTMNGDTKLGGFYARPV